MPSLLSIALAPLILLVSIPLFVFAIFTTTLAFSTLLIRVLVVYVELAIVVTHNHFSASASASAPSKQQRSPSQPKSHRSISTSRSSSGSLTPKLLNAGNTVYPTTPLARDFEGVGGWRFPDPDEDEDSDSLWTGMNARLELPALGVVSSNDFKSKHERSLIPLSERPGLRRAGSQRTRPFSAFVSGTTSPEEVYGEGRMSKSVADLGEAGLGLGLGMGMNVGKARVRYRQSSSGSTGCSETTLRGVGLGG